MICSLECAQFHVYVMSTVELRLRISESVCAKIFLHCDQKFFCLMIQTTVKLFAKTNFLIGKCTLYEWPFIMRIGWNIFNF